MHDILTEILGVLQLHSLVYCQSQIHRQDWALCFTPVRGAAFHVVSQGQCRLSDGTHEVVLSAGDVLVLPYGTEHQIADRQNATPRAVIDLDDGQEQPCRVLRWGDSPEGTTLICGIFKLEAYNTPGMLSLLPPLLYFPAGSNHSNGIATAVNTLIEEANADRQGKLAILHRLADILFVQLIRAWLADPSTEASGWLAGMRDPQLASSLSAIHAQPAHAWTVGQLASHAAMSRSAFAARFTEIIGVPPATYLVGWRMQLGAQLLSDPNLSVVQVAMRVGYASDIAFSRAFKRLHGMSPAAYRRGVGAQG